MRKVIKGINDLATTNPEVAKDWNYPKNGNDLPGDFLPGSDKKVWWKCHKCGHEWKTSIGHRTHGRGCPCCSGKVASRGINDLETLFPSLAAEWDYEKNELKPYQVTPGSNKKVWWICPNGHDSYFVPVVNRTHGAGCTVCNTMFQTSFPEQTILFYIKKLFPDAINRYKGLFKTTMELDIYIPSIKVAIEYDGAVWHKFPHSNQRENKKYKICKENGIYLYRVREESNNQDNADKVYNVPAFSYSKISDFDEMISLLIKDISSESNVDVNIGRDMFDILQYKIIKFEDSLASQFPELCKEWHPTLNKGLKPENVLPGTALKVWWKCQKCGNEWQASVCNRTKGHGCDVCANVQRKITYHKVRLETRELLIGCKCVEDWDYEKNKHNPDYYTKSSAEEVWWKCHKCGYEWKTAIFNRTRNGRKNDCPSCTRRILTRGVNDLLTTNPQLVANEWDFDLNQTIKPSDVTQWSRTKVWWKCPKCGYQYKATPGNKVFGKGCGCCAGRIVVPGINDLATTRPDLAIDWHPTKNGPLMPTNVTKGRRDMIWWKCHVCGNEWQDSLNHRNGGRGCPVCNKKAKSNAK